MTVTAGLTEDGDLRGLARREYDQLIAAGAFDDESLELLDGGLFRMSPQSWAHWSLTEALRRHLERAWWAADEQRYLVTTHSPVVAGELSEPEPDLYVYDADARSQPRLPDFAHLVVEVAQTSQGRDLVRKPRIYAAAGFPEYWVVDLPAAEVVVHRDPRIGTGQYGAVTRLPLTAELTVLGVPVRLADLAS